MVRREHASRRRPALAASKPRILVYCCSRKSAKSGSNATDNAEPAYFTGPSTAVWRLVRRITTPTLETP
jgi:hypothetical protein